MRNVALVTGATKGIGKVIALKLAELGYDLMIVGRNHTELLNTKKEVEKYKVKCALAIADLAEIDTPSCVVNKLMKEFGGLDVVVNNAGLAKSLPIKETSIDVWDKIFKVNARAPYFICKEAVPYLKRSKNPVIINIGSVVDFKGYINQSAYASSKHALAGFTKCWPKRYSPMV